jgi:hypothetical protein
MFDVEEEFWASGTVQRYSHLFPDSPKPRKANGLLVSAIFLARRGPPLSDACPRAKSQRATNSGFVGESRTDR